MIDFSHYSYIKPIIITHHLENDVSLLLDSNHHQNTKQHVLSVAKTSQRLARQFDVDEDICYQAALLHDISAIIKPSDMITIAISHHYSLEPSEQKYPFLLHQYISSIIASDIFDIQDQRILDAIACHTTLKAQPTKYDMILFLADKISWDQKGTPPYLSLIKEALQDSLEKACYEYIRYLFKNHLLLCPHRHLKDARDMLYQKYLPIELRKWQESDAQAFYQHSHHDQLYQYMNNGFPKTLEACQQCVKEFSISQDEIKAIVLDGEIIGCVGAFMKEKEAELAYWLDFDYWNQGIMSLALERFIQYLFSIRNIEIVHAKPFHHNKASIHLLEKLSFQKHQDLYIRRKIK